MLHYDLPDDRIAQTPVEPRDSARLLCVPRGGGPREHEIFRDIAERIRPDDLLVVNETRVSAVRLLGQRTTGAQIEALLLRPRPEHGPTAFDALVRPGRVFRTGKTIAFHEIGLSATVLGEVPDESGARLLLFSGEPGDTLSRLDRWGKTPLPPYITAPLADPTRYQTVYAAMPGSAAAPTAGLHFTPELLTKISANGTKIARLRLDVGLGTFRPVRDGDVENHVMHTETYSVPDEVADAVNSCSGRVIAVGTTSLRALESAARTARAGQRVAAIPDGATDLFVTPGYEFRAVDALITNFHQPGSTLLLLVAAFVGEAAMRDAYDDALRSGYRFLSFGDAMFAFPAKSGAKMA